VLKEGAKCTEQDVQEYMNKLVTRTKRLTGGVHFVEMIPKNPSGKILRKLLRDQAQAELVGAKAKL
jgi:4-coumarate--CoA ligase